MSSCHPMVLHRMLMLSIKAKPERATTAANLATWQRTVGRGRPVRPHLQVDTLRAARAPKERGTPKEKGRASTLEVERLAKERGKGKDSKGGKKDGRKDIKALDVWGSSGVPYLTLVEYW